MFSSFFINIFMVLTNFWYENSTTENFKISTVGGFYRERGNILYWPIPKHRQDIFFNMIIFCTDTMAFQISWIQFSYLFPIWKKENFGHRGWNLRNNRDSYRHMYIFLIRKKKDNFFKKCLCVSPLVRPCAKVMYTKTQERLKIIEWGFFCLKGVYWERPDPNARRLRKLEPNAIFNDFAISREPFDEIDTNFFFFLKIWTRKYHQTRARRFPKLKPNETSSSHVLVFKLNNKFNIS